MHILITGISGFTGRYVERELISRGHFVSGLNSNLLDTTSLKKEILSQDIDAVIHLAGISYAESKNIQNIYNVNIIGTLNLLKVLDLISSNLKSVIVASSASVYGNNHKNPIVEESPLNPISHYAISKACMENMAKLYMDKIPILLTRPFNYTGVGQSTDFLIPKIIYHFKEKKQLIELGNLDVYREFGDVRDVAKIYANLLENNLKNKIVNICTGKTYQLREVFNRCAKISNHIIELKTNPLLNRPNDPLVLCGDNTKLVKEVKCSCKYNLKETLNWMFSFE